MNHQAAYENVRSQVGCCGIWCGSCAVGNGSLKRLTTKYEDVIRSHGLEHWAPADLDYKQFTAGLAAVRRVAACAGCRKGGGRDQCEMRACCRSRALNDCLECPDRADCPHEKSLNHMRSGARDAGLFVKDDGGDHDALLSRWETELRSVWPSVTLFMDDEQGARQ